MGEGGWWEVRGRKGREARDGRQGMETGEGGVMGRKAGCEGRMAKREGIGVDSTLLAN